MAKRILKTYFLSVLSMGICATAYPTLLAQSPQGETTPPPATATALPSQTQTFSFPILERGDPMPLAPTKTWFSFLSPEPISGLYYKVRPQNKLLPVHYKQINIRGRGRSDTYPFNMPSGPLELYWLPKAPGLPPELALRCELPPGNENSMLVLQVKNSQDPKEKPKLDYFVIDIGDRAFPAGSYMVINISGYPLAGTLDGQIFRPIPPVIKPKQKRGSDLDLDIYVYLEQENRISNVTRSKLYVGKNNRYMACFFPPRDKNRPRLALTVLREQINIDTKAMDRMIKQLETDNAAE